jgi:hypothetical protein
MNAAVRVRFKNGCSRGRRVKHLAAECRALAKSRSSCQELLTDPLTDPLQFLLFVPTGRPQNGLRTRSLPLISNPS